MKILSIIIITLLIILIVKTVRVGMELRMLHLYADEQGLHHAYFTEPGNGKAPKLLGEEIFKNGQKIFDNYKEND